MQAKRRAFTLVELLIVIAILSLLAGLLLPALENALQAARTVRCHNNFKQLGIGWMLYADEWEGYLAHQPDGTPSWGARLRPYVGEYCLAGSGDGWNDLPNAVEANPCMCPSYEFDWLAKFAPPVPHPDIARTEYWAFTTCQPNEWLKESNHYGLPRAQGFRRLTALRQPSEAILIGETRENVLGHWRDLHYNPNHGFGAPTLQADGSVRNRPYDHARVTTNLFYTWAPANADAHSAAAFCVYLNPNY